MIQEIIAVVIAIAIWDLSVILYNYIFHRKPDLKCDGCGQVKKLYKVRGQRLYYCHRCRQAYMRELKNGEITYVDNKV
jgi:hypothetical protein